MRFHLFGEQFDVASRRQGNHLQSLRQRRHYFQALSPNGACRTEDR
jgi:hypothetical protein